VLCKRPELIKFDDSIAASAPPKTEKFQSIREPEPCMVGMYVSLSRRCTDGATCTVFSELEGELSKWLDCERNYDAALFAARVFDSVLPITCQRRRT
jgi:hypothetical protein